MITCKEDLIDTYIENDFGELRDLYIKIALEHNVKVCGGGGCDYLLSKNSIGVRDWGSGSQFEWNNGDFENAKLITLPDLKPTPTKFVKVEESIFDLKGEFERGELYSSNCEGHYTQLKCEKKFYLAAHQDSVYRQVDVDWRDEVAEFTGLGKDFYTWVDCIDDMYNFDFVEMCHLVASLTEKPTN